MNRNRVNSTLFPLINLLIILGMSYGAEVLKAVLQSRSNQFLINPNNLLWSNILVTLVIGGLLAWLIGTFWRSSSFPVGVAVIYLIVGLYVILTPFLFYKSLPMIRWFVFLPAALGFNSLFYFSGAIITMLGVYRLLRLRGFLSRR